jgi:hypothetical protein
MVRVIEARHVRDYVISVLFADGVEGEVDLKDQLYGEVFGTLSRGRMEPTLRRSFYTRRSRLRA